MKKCPKCNKIKTLDSFSKDKSKKDGSCPTCKSCRQLQRNNEYKRRNPNKIKNEKLKYLYGITLEEYNRLLEQQKGGCAICGEIDNNKKLAVDHDHKTGKVRGLLCDKHNKGLGDFQDNEILLQKAIDYLKTHKI